MQQTPLQQPPYTWSFLKRHFEKRHLNTQHNFKRTNNVEARYQTILTALGKKKQPLARHVIRQFRLNKQSRPLSIDPNTYPYDLEAPLTHWVLWVHPNVATPSTHAIDTMLRTYFRNFNSPIQSDPRVDLVWFQNSTDKQSIKQLRHYHVIVFMPPHSKPPRPPVLPPSPLRRRHQSFGPGLLPRGRRPHSR